MTLGIIDQIFAKLAARYGSRWTAQWSDSDLLKLARNEWFEALQHMGVEEIKNGLESWQGDWPPNIMEFKRYCKPSVLPACYQEFYRPLPAPTNRSIGRKALDKMKADLGMA